MKKILFTTLLISLLPVLLKGQATKTVYAEKTGITHAGAMFDTRFHGESGFGFATGIYAGRIRTKRVSSFGENREYSPYIPVEINYLTAGRLHHFEAAAGMNFAYVNNKHIHPEYTYLELGQDFGQSRVIYHSPEHTDKEKGLGYEFYLKAGYRYQATNRVMFKAGFNLGFNIGGKAGIVRYEKTPYMYLGVGWAF